MQYRSIINLYVGDVRVGLCENCYRIDTQPAKQEMHYVLFASHHRTVERDIDCILLEAVDMELLQFLMSNFMPVSPGNLLHIEKDFKSSSDGIMAWCCLVPLRVRFMIKNWTGLG